MAVVPDLPYGRQSIDDDDIAAVAAVLRSDFLTTGPTIAAFEAALSSHTGSKFAAVLNSGTAALHAAYAAAGVERGDEVITSPLTFAATANAALYLGARPVFADVDPETGTIDPAAVAQAITPRTRAVVAVDYAGHPAAYDDLRALRDEHGFRLIADAAHSLGATYRGDRVGTLADMTMLSFHPVKLITTGEGGAVLTDSSDLFRAILEFRSHGVTRDPTRFHRLEGPWHYEVQGLGYNYRLTDIQAALGISQLNKLDRFIARRRFIAREYSVAFAELTNISAPAARADIEHAWHLYVVRARSGVVGRRRLYDGLRDRGLGVQVHYMPVYLHPLYQELGYATGLCPNAEAFYGSAVSIPIFPSMSDADVGRVIDAVVDVDREC